MRRIALALLCLLAAPAWAQEGDPPAALVLPVDRAPSIPVRSIPVPGSTSVTLVATPAAEGVARELAPRIVEEREDLARLLGRTDDGPVEIRFGMGRNEFQSLQPGGNRVPSWAAGIAYPDIGLVVVDALASSRGGTPASVLRHELAHVALGRLGLHDVPRWFSEGFAQVHAGEWSLARSTTLARAAASKSLIDLDDLEHRFPASPADVDLAYAQSASVVAFLARIDGGAAMHRLFAHAAAGAPFSGALASGFGQPLIALEVDWRREVRSRYGFVALLFDDHLVWTAGALVVVYAAMRVRRRRKKRLDDLGRAEDAERELRAEAARRAWLESQTGRSAGLPRFL